MILNKKTAITAIGLIGFISLTAGFYLTYGLKSSLMFSGSLCLLFSLRASAVAAKADRG
jgi:hypothetical protein